MPMGIPTPSTFNLEVALFATYPQEPVFEAAAF
jgi:hypothetical protein